MDAGNHIRISSNGDIIIGNRMMKLIASSILVVYDDDVLIGARMVEPIIISMVLHNIGNYLYLSNNSSTRSPPMTAQVFEHRRV